jgi:hypothetical protein
VAFLVLARVNKSRAMDIADKGNRKALGEMVAIENRDIGQMVEGNNEYRRRRGEEELSEEDVRSAVGRQEMGRLGGTRR